MARTSLRSQGISVITCTNRPLFFRQILCNYSSQLYPVKELVIVLNKDGMSLKDCRRKVRKYPNVYVYRLPERISLGKCLNYGIRRSKHPFIAKFDDDDYYSPHYLTEQIKALQRSGADVVGKRTYFAYLRAKKLLILRFPGAQNRFSARIAGATLFFKRKVFERVPFPDRSLGEDVAFLQGCRRRGYKIYSASPFHFAQIRRPDRSSHTWTVSDRGLMKGAKMIAKTDDFRRYVNRVAK
jgi:GT2 family glycosyltransferase